MVRPLKDALAGLGFGPQIAEMPHGQAWGLRLRVSKYKQIHIKAMPNGVIESEAEPPTEYPFAHLNPEHSYSSHRDVLRILRRLRIPFQMVRDVPPTCQRPVAVHPENPVGWEVLAWAVLGFGLGATVAIAYRSRS